MNMKRWCPECSLMVYGCPHEEVPVDAVGPEAKTLSDMVGSAPKGNYRLRTTFLTFAKTVASGEETVVIVHPQLVFKSLRLVVDPLIAPYFSFLDVRIGQFSQGGSYSPGVRCTVFPPDPLDKLPVNNLEGIDTTREGQWYGLHVRNDSPSVQDFSAIVWGQRIGY